MTLVYFGPFVLPPRRTGFWVTAIAFVYSQRGGIGKLLVAIGTSEGKGADSCMEFNMAGHVMFVESFERAVWAWAEELAGLGILSEPLNNIFGRLCCQFWLSRRFLS